MPRPDRYRRIRRVLWAVLLLNLLVAAAKIAYGTFSNSAAMEADGFHSLFDAASNVTGLVGLWFAARPPDRDHPYGHGKFESFAAALIAIMLVLAGYSVGRGAIDSLLSRGEATQVTLLSFVVMLVTLAINSIVTLWERRAGRRLGSEILLADASHTFSDVLVSVGVIVSLVLVSVGWQEADGVVALLVALVILRTAWGVISGVLKTLGDAAILPVDDVEAYVRQVPGVLDCHRVRTRGSQAHVYIDLHVLVESQTSVEQGHAIAHQVEETLRSRYSEIADVVVHVEPRE